jgi:hypothetical protein
VETDRAPCTVPICQGPQCPRFDRLLATEPQTHQPDWAIEFLEGDTRSGSRGVRKRAMWALFLEATGDALVPFSLSAATAGEQLARVWGGTGVRRFSGLCGVAGVDLSHEVERLSRWTPGRQLQGSLWTCDWGYPDNLPGAVCGNACSKYGRVSLNKPVSQQPDADVTSGFVKLHTFKLETRLTAL